MGYYKLSAREKEKDSKGGKMNTSKEKFAFVVVVMAVVLALVASGCAPGTPVG